METPSCYRDPLLHLLSSALLFLFVLPAPAQTDDIHFQRIGPSEGLPVEGWMDMYQDMHGFLWFANVRYDGREFKSYPDGTPNAVRVGELLADNWGGAPDSLFYYDPVRDAFIHNYPSYIKEFFVSIMIEWEPIYCDRCFFKDDNRHIWFGTGDRGLFVYSIETKSFQNIRHSAEDSTSLSSDNLSFILQDRQEQIWVATWSNGLNLWTKDSTFLRFQNEPGNPNSLSSDNITYLLEDRMGMIWVGTFRGLNRLNPLTKEITRIPLPESVNPLVRKIFLDTGGRLWLGTGPQGRTRIVIFDPPTGKFRTSFKIQNEKHAIYAYGNSQIFSVLEDDRNRIWMGTSYEGLNLFDPHSDEVFSYKFDPRNPESLSNNSVRFMMRDGSGRIWISTFSDINMYDPNAKSFVHLESDHTGQNYFNSYPKWNGLEDQNGNIWITSAGSGLIRFDPESKSFKIYDKALSNSFLSNRFFKVAEDDAGNIWITEGLARLHILNPFTEQIIATHPFHKVNALYQDSKGRMWAGCYEGLVVFTDASAEPTLLKWESFEGYFGQSDYHILGIIEDCEGNFWLSTMFDGLLKVNLQKKLLQQFSPLSAIPNSVGVGNIYRIALDRNCNLWMALPGNGLFMLPADQQNTPAPNFQNWNTENSNLPNNNVKHVLEDQKGRIWVSSSQGISQFDRTRNTFHTYGPEVGMKTNPVSLILAKDGRIYMGGLNGIGYFHPDRLAVNKHIPPVYLKDIQIDGKSLPLQGTPGDTLPFPSPLQQSITLTKEIRLKHNQNDLRLEFVALNYTAPERNQFKYQLIGYDEEWQSTDAVNPYATYTNLDPGEYTFRVIGANNDGYWNTEGATLQIIITPPWWRTGWAYLVYAVLILAGLLGFYRFQLNRQLAAAETRRLRELDEVKTKLYTNITHEFRTPLTVILGMADQMERNPKEWFREGLRMIRRNGQNLLTLVQQMLDLRRLESGTLPVNLIQGDVVNYLQYLTESFHAYAESKDIRLHFLCPYEALHLDYDPEKLLTIVSNLLSNAVKYTPEGGDVYIATSAERTSSALRTLQIEVQDTGPGIPEQKLPQIFDRFYQADDSATRRGEGTGIGLALTKELVQLLGGSIQVASTQGKGTTFTIRLPVTRNAKKESQQEEKPAKEKIGVVVPPAPNQETFEATTNTAEDQPLALLVEDNEDVIRYLSTCLESDYRLAIARNGREGIEKALELMPDVIISDVMMPEKDGYEVTATLKQDFRTSHIPIILLTAKADATSRLEGLEQGADAYLTKPFQPEELEVRLRKLVELRRELQERYRPARFSKSGRSSDDPEDAFLQKFRQVIEKHMSDEHFGTPQLLKAMNISRTQLHHKLKTLTGKSTSQMINSIRLHKAKELLENTDLNVSEVALEVGFNSLTYFSSSFSKEFGMPPSQVCK